MYCLAGQPGHNHHINVGLVAAPGPDSRVAAVAALQERADYQRFEVIVAHQPLPQTDVRVSQLALLRVGGADFAYQFLQLVVEFHRRHPCVIGVRLFV